MDSERRERQIADLCDLWRSVPHTEPSRLLQMLAERATATLDAHTGSVLLRERGSDMLRMVASIGMAQDITESVTLLVGERIAGRVAATGKAIVVHKDPRQHPLLRDTGTPGDIAPRPEVESALCAPLVDVDGEVLGVLCLSRHTPALPFGDGDLQIASLFAAQAGVAIGQMRLRADLARHEEEIRLRAETERETAQNARLTALGQMAVTVAHELRNPLSAVKGAAQFVLTQVDNMQRRDGSLPSPETLRDFLTIVVDEVNGLDRLTTDLLEFASPSLPQRKRCDLALLIHHEMNFLRSTLESLGVEEVCEACAVGLPAWVDADAGQVGRALRNLLLNAAQAIESREPEADGVLSPGQITVSLLPADANGQRNGNGYNGYVVSVEDNGVGIPPELHERLWEPFFTTRVKGTGLGLSQVRQVAYAHGGRADFSPTAGGGTRFLLQLPAATAEDTRS